MTVDSPPGTTSASSPSRSLGTRTSRGCAPSDAQQLRMRVEVALESEDADQLTGHGYQPRGDSSCSDSSFELSRLTIGCPRPVDAAATRAGSR